jgi:hypothetical protein
VGLISRTNGAETTERSFADSYTVYGPLAGRAQNSPERTFHWPLEFPDVMAAGGFDVVLGNPPWERIKLQEQEFFASRDPEIAEAPGGARTVDRQVEKRRARHTRTIAARGVRGDEACGRSFVRFRPPPAVL